MVLGWLLVYPVLHTHMLGLPSRSLSRRLFAVMVALLSVLPLSAAQGTQYFCRMMRQVTSACCCGPSHRGPGEQHVDSGPKLEPRDCCERVQRFEPATAPAVRDASVHIPAPFLAAVLSFSDAVVAPALRGLGNARVQARAPPPPRVPIFLLNCALLT
jgi:hypothetical protein